MGVYFKSCGSCKEFIQSNYTFYFDETIQIMNELLQKEEIQKFLFETNELNKKDTFIRVEKFMNCSHCFCDFCIKPTEVFILNEIEEHFDVDEVNFEEDTVFNNAYNYILALMTVECKECNKKQETKPIENELEVVIHDLKIFREEVELCLKKQNRKEKNEQINKIISKLENIK